MVERDVCDWDTRALESDLVLSAAEIDQFRAQRFGTDQHAAGQFHGAQGKPTFQGGLKADPYIRTMVRQHERKGKASPSGPIQSLQQREEERADVTEVHMENLCVLLMERAFDSFRLGPIDLHGATQALFLNESPQRVCRGLRKTAEFREWKRFLVLSLLAKDDGAKPLHSCDLPIHMPHLRLEKSDNVLDRNWSDVRSGSIGVHTRAVD
jgi:hypothetical protein